MTFERRGLYRPLFHWMVLLVPAISRSRNCSSSLRKSGMIEERKLTDFLHSDRRDGPPMTRPLTDEMVRDGVLTNFQAEQFLLGNGAGSPSASTSCWSGSASAGWGRCSSASTCS